MEPELDFSPLLLVSALAFLIPLVTHRLTAGIVPPVVGEIVAGVIFGRAVFGVIDEHEWLEFLSLFGFAYLMFRSGLEINVGVLRRPLGSGWRSPRVALRQPLLAGTLIVLLTLPATALGVWALNAANAVDDFWMLLFILTATAAGVMTPVLKHRDDVGALGQAILVSGFLLEFAAIIGLGIAAVVEREGLGSKRPSSWPCRWPSAACSG